jgi:hypothetical protein
MALTKKKKRRRKKEKKTNLKCRLFEREKRIKGIFLSFAKDSPLAHTCSRRIITPAN